MLKVGAPTAEFGLNVGPEVAVVEGSVVDVVVEKTVFEKLDDVEVVLLLSAPVPEAVVGPLGTPVEGVSVIVVEATGPAENPVVTRVEVVVPGIYDELHLFQTTFVWFP